MTLVSSSTETLSFTTISANTTTATIRWLLRVISIIVVVSSGRGQAEASGDVDGDYLLQLYASAGGNRVGSCLLPSWGVGSAGPVCDPSRSSMTSTGWSNSSCNGMGRTCGSTTLLCTVGVYYSTWCGVACSNVTHRVQVLNLESCGLQGTLPPIPSGTLASLKGLWLASNALSGSIPGGLENLGMLLFVDLSSNKLTGSIPDTMSQLVSLQLVSLDDNQLTGTFPSWIATSWVSLVTLSMATNALQGTFPLTALSRSLSALQRLVVHVNQFNGYMEAISSDSAWSSTLEQLSLSSNPFSGGLPVSFGSLRSLKLLYVASNTLQGTLPNSLLSLVQLRDADFSNNALSGLIPDFFANLGNLVSLQLQENQFATAPPFSPTIKSTTLRIFRMSSNLLSGPLDATFSGLVAMRSLTNMELCCNQLIGTIPEWISSANFPSLQTLDLSQNKLSGLIPVSLGSFSATLTILSLGQNAALGRQAQSFPSFLTGLTSLQALDLSSIALVSSPYPLCTQTTSSVSSSCCWSSLQTLRLVDIQLNGTLPEVMPPYLQSLSLSSNHFSGTIPTSWHTLTSLRYLSLQINAIVGTIPDWIGGSATALESILLGGNGLTGTLPNTFSRLGATLVTLEVWSNFLSGPFPTSLLVSLSQLQQLDLHNNSFYGTVPFDVLASAVPKLTRLTMNANYQLNGSLPATAAAWMPWRPSLEYLQLGECNFTGTIPEHIGTVLWRLRLLELSFNRFEGTLPETLGNLSSLTTLDVRGNRLTGSLLLSPTWYSLRNYLVNGNRLSGTISSRNLSRLPMLADFEAAQIISQGFCRIQTGPRCIRWRRLT